MLIFSFSLYNSFEGLPGVAALIDLFRATNEVLEEVDVMVEEGLEIPPEGQHRLCLREPCQST
ncbi:hypothetical protein K7432_013814 [Basidiobolus ranarum]|uniref:Uncharacterized protein n=1 Tax=Basidiobolus ranarum TaxID=34480 RepID=A0ABR2WIN6_9FUNG